MRREPVMQRRDRLGRRRQRPSGIGGLPLETREPDGERDVTVISGAEPAAVRGDVLAVTGLVMADDVIWAADLRPAGGGGRSAP